MTARVATRETDVIEALGPDHEAETAILVSIADRGHAGRNPYAALFALLRPILEGLGSVTVVDRPETRLAFAALRAEERGDRPIHLAFGPPHEIFLSPAVATAVVPLWGFPDIPETDLCRNPRQNWRRVLSRADALIVGDSASAASFAGEVDPDALFRLPTPVSHRLSFLPEWTPERRTILECRHTVRGGPVEPVPTVPPEPTPASAIPAPKSRLRGLPGKAKRLAGRSAKQSYHRYVRRWISDDAHERLRGLKRAILRRPAPPAAAPSGPTTPPRGRAVIGGTVFLAEVDYRDPGVNDRDLLTAYLHACRDRSDVTLVVLLRSSPDREHEDVARFEHGLESIKIRHACRVLLISETLDEEDFARVMEAATFVIDTRSQARETWLVNAALASGRPVIAPAHTALRDRVDATVGYPIRSSAEPGAWPQHPERAMESILHRLDWSELRDRIVRACAIDHEEHRRLADAARSIGEPFLDADAIRDAWRRALDQIAPRSTSALGWDETPRKR